MTLTASNIQHVFLALMALSVLTECLLTILHTHAAERAATCVPAPFERKLSAAAHRKAADYTGELAQGRLLLVFAGAGIALLLTYGQGLTLLASLAGALSSSAFCAAAFRAASATSRKTKASGSPKTSRTP